MATRKSEWLASIKPILDRDAATRDAKELARELSDILDVSVGTDTDSLEQLIKEFNRQLKEMGKQEVVFSEKTLHGIVGQFAAAITEGISSGIAGGIGSGAIGQIADKIGDGVGDAIRDSVGSALNDVSKEMAKKLTELENRRAEIHKQTEKLDKRYQKYSDMYDILSRDEEANISPLKAEEDLDQQALKILEDFTSAEDALTDAEERRLEAEKALKKVDRTDIDAKKKAMDALKQSTQEYNTALVKASSAAVNMYRMGETLKQNKDRVKDQSLLSEFSTKGLFETTSDVSEQWMQYFEGYDEVSIKLSKKLTLELENINAQIEEIRKNYPDIVNVAATDSAVKSLNEIAAAYERIAKKAKQVHTEIAKDVIGAIEYEPGSESLTVLSNRYQKSRDSNEDWEVQYQWMVKFVKEYEAYLKQIDEEEDKLKKKNMRARAKRYEELYGEVKPVAQNAEQMLREIAKRAGHQFDGDATGSSGSGGGADEAERTAEAKRKAAEEEARLRAEAEERAKSERLAREEAEAKAKAEKEAADALKKQRLEEEKLAKTAEKKRLEDEAARLKTYTGYRAIEPPESSGKTKHDAIADWGGEYFSTDPKVAASYGENFFKEGNIIIGEITPKNPLVINANGLRWDEFDKMPQLKELFPGLLDLMKQPGYIGDDGQKYINDQARSAGYDSVILENVQDALDGDIKNYNLSTTIAVLDDKIVSLTGSMAQLEAGTNKFSNVVSPEIPSYYVGGQRGGKDSVTEVQDVGTAFKRLIDYIKSSGQEPKQFFDALAGGAQNVDDELKQILTTLDLFDSQGNLNLKSIESGFTNLGGMVSDTYTLIARGKDYLPKSQDLMPKLEDAKKMGANVGEILDVFEDETTGRIYELQKTMPGTIIPDNTDFLQATDDQILNLIADLQTLHKTGLYVDFGNDNILYDKEQGFSFIDLGTKFQEGQETVAGTAQELLKSIKPVFADNELFGDFENRLVSIANMLGVKIPQAAQNAERAIDELNVEQDQDYGSDDAEVIAKENGALEDKLELLRDIAEQYGHTITQKQRDRFEELNQKYMNEGLTPKEDERYWELGEQIEEADSALEEFEQTYDRIIIKLANGKKVEILPDDKGLRTLSKIDEEYGESYNGVEIEDVIYERIQKEAVAAEQAVDSLNDSIEETKNITQGSGSGTGTGDASSSELEAAATKVEALQDEVEQKNQELVNKNAEIARIQAESDAEKRALNDAKATLQNDLDDTRQQLEDAEYTRDLYDSAMNQITEESNEKDRIIYDLREQLANVKTGTGEEQASVSSEELKNVLSSIVYNVKIAHDDNDKTANKIAIDESALESILKRVFTNVLNPQTEQNDSGSKNEPWALEKTLLSVNEALGNIQTNTAKSDSIEVAPAKTDVGNVLATENTLTAIKTAVESINTKVVKGAKAKTSENSGGKKSGVGKKNAESYAGSQYFPEKLKTQTMQLAKFRAQLMTTGKLTDDVDAQIYELLDGLKQVQNGPDFSAWSQKFQQLKTSVGITDIFDKAEDKDAIASYKQLVEFQKERNKLELQYEKAQAGSALKQFYAEQLTQMNSVIAKQEEMLENEEYEAKLAKIREEQARKLGEVEAKAADKVAKKTAADQKKLDKRRAMTGKAGSAIGRAENIWLEAEGLEQAKLPDGFKKQVSEYYDALDKLRLKHHEINTSEVVTDEQQAELIRQTKEVNDLTNAIGPLVAEYQKFSGANVDEANSRATTLTGASSLNDYEAQLKQYVKSITDGKGQIKSFNAETKTLTYTVKTGKNEFTEYTAAVRHLDNQMVAVQGTTKRTETFFEATTRKMKELTSYFSGMAVFNFAKQELRRGIQYIREIDLALTELKKVTSETEETYDKFLDTAAKTAEKVGSTIQKVVSSTADWARLGYSMKEAAKFAESTQILMNVSEFTDVSQATDTLISAVQAFGYTAETSMDVVDLLNTIGKQNCRNYIVIYG